MEKGVGRLMGGSLCYCILPNSRVKLRHQNWMHTHTYLGKAFNVTEEQWAAEAGLGQNTLLFSIQVGVFLV